jgi:riboflavin transporter FmnP
MKAKEIAFITIMGALGNLLFIASSPVLPLAPGVSFDFSHTTTFIAALFGGPLIGFISGLFVGLFPGIYYGPLGFGAWLGLIGLPIGKALTGLTCGFLANKLDLHERQHSSLFTIPITLFSYIPECLFTIAYFMILMPHFLGSGGVGILVSILPKAWIEIIVISVLMAALIGNHGFKNFIAKFFLVPKFGSRVSKKLT